MLNKRLLQSYLRPGVMIAALLTTTLPLMHSHAQGLKAIVVNTLSDDPAVCSKRGTACLRNVIIAADNDQLDATTITFSVSGSIMLNNPLDVANSSTNPVTIDGSLQKITLDGGQNVQIFTAEYNSALNLRQLTLQHGHSLSSGGAIAGNNAMLSIDHCQIVDNNASNAGGGIAAENGSLTITDSRIAENMALGRDGGGGIAVGGLALTIRDSIVENNVAPQGGGGGLTIDEPSGPALIDHSAIRDNKSGGDGGGLYQANGSIVIQRSTVSGNTSGHLGGGISNGGTMLISNSTLIGNTVNSGSATGGGLFNQGVAIIANSTITGNQVTGASNASGGGVDNNGQLFLFSNVIAGNKAPTWPDVAPVYDLIDIRSLGYNVIGDNTDGSGKPSSSTIPSLIDGKNNDQVGLTTQPIDPMFASALADNGDTLPTGFGVPQTIALEPGSLAIGTGSCAGSTLTTPPIPAVTTDERGVARKSRCDVGAYETTAGGTATAAATP